MVADRVPEELGQRDDYLQGLCHPQYPKGNGWDMGVKQRDQSLKLLESIQALNEILTSPLHSSDFQILLGCIRLDGCCSNLYEITRTSKRKIKHKSMWVPV